MIIIVGIIIIMINTVDVILIISGLVDLSGAVDWRLKGYDKDNHIFIFIIVILLILLLLLLIIIIVIINNAIIITSTILIFNAIITCGSVRVEADKS